MNHWRIKMRSEAGGPALLGASMLLSAWLGCSSEPEAAGTQPGTMNPGVMMGGGSGAPPPATGGIGAPPVAGSGATMTGGSAAPITGGSMAMPMAGAGMMPAGSGSGMDPMMMPDEMNPPVMMGEYHDPGTGEWEKVPEDQVGEVCKMDINMLKSTGITQSFAIFRYGKLCYESGADSPSDVFSCTKSFGGIVTGYVQYLVRDAPKSGPGTGQFHDYDLASDWGLAGYLPGMQLGYLMSMCTGSRSLEWEGGRSWAYDTLGTAGLNNMASVANKALSGASVGVANIQAATTELFGKLGMSDSSWGGAIYGTGAITTLHDMGKLFTMMIHGGVYNGERVLSEEWVYKMTHPAFEDANTSYGQFMWLNHRGNAAGIGGDIATGSNSPDGDPCSPPAFWQRYPHEISDAPDCQATVPGSNCHPTYDIGNYSCQGLGGQFAIGHPGLDLVLTIKNFSGMDGPMGFWKKIRPALVAMDPKYKGDEAAFCKDYGAGEYAPDLKYMIQQPPDP